MSIPLSVEKPIVINKSIETVFSLVSNFEQWTPWSPWLCQEPNCPVTRSGTAGEVEVTSLAFNIPSYDLPYHSLPYVQRALFI